ncbi:hypothetical protein ACOME3_008027 [Neoechinorhynchus agilis]
MEMLPTPEEKGHVKVLLRVRPLSINEQRFKSVICVDEDEALVSVVNPARTDDVRSFKFDAVYAPSASTETIFLDQITKVIDSSLGGVNSTVLVYGQTGTGKTFTMEGSDELGSKGFYWLALNYILKDKQNDSQKRNVFISFVEFYKEDINDLLVDRQNQRSLELRGDGKDWIVHGLHRIQCNDADQIDRIIKQAQIRRAKGVLNRSTKMNVKSSRSHSILIIEIDNMSIRSRLYMIDLAGSERLSKSGSIGDRMSEATKINLALSALTNVILALTTRRPHIPYRDSKLTRLLKDSLGGTADVTVIATCGPASYNYEETLQTIKYAQRCMGISNSLKVNHIDDIYSEDSHSTRINRLKCELAKPSTDSFDFSVSSNSSRTSIVRSSNVSSFSSLKSVPLVDEEQQAFKDKEKQLQGLEGCYKRLQSELMRMTEKAVTGINEYKRILEELEKESAYYEAVIDTFIPPEDAEYARNRLVLSSDGAYYHVRSDFDERKFAMQRLCLWDFVVVDEDSSGQWQLQNTDRVWIPNKEAIIEAIRYNTFINNSSDDEF